MRRGAASPKHRGAAAVEFAVVLPVLIAILCGTIDWGYYFFTREVVINAAREAARVGSLQFGPGVDPIVEARTAAGRYLGDAQLTRTTTIETDVDADGIAGNCPAEAACVRITYDLGGSVTGFTGSFVPSSIVAYARMRR